MESSSLIDAVVFQNLRRPIFSAPPSISKTAAIDGLVGAGADHVRGSFFAEQQGERVDEDGFAGAGFAGQEIQPGGELYRQVVDDRVIFKSQFDEHDGRPGIAIS